MMRNPRVLFLMTQLQCGGAEQVLLNILNGLSGASFDVEVCTVYGRGQWDDRVPKTVRLWSLFANHSWLARLVAQLSCRLGSGYCLQKLLSYRMGERRYDVEVAFTEGLPVKLIGMRQSDARKVAWIHTDKWVNQETGKFFRSKEELRCYNQMAQVVFVSAEAKKQFEQLFPSCMTKKTVIYNSLNRADVGAKAGMMPLVKKRFTICSVGRLVTLKRYDRVVRLAKRLKDEGVDVDFWLIGNGKQLRELQMLSERLEVTDRVCFKGYQDNPYPYIKQADLLLSCSTVEGFSLVVGEAMLLGTPVVATRTTGPNEILDDGKYGALCNHDDDSIHDAVITLIKDDKMRRHYAQQAIIRSQMFDWEQMRGKVEEVLSF